MRDPLLLTVLLVCAVQLRGPAEFDPVDGFAVLTRNPPLALDLARDGAERLAWLPGVGVGRARAIVAARPYLPRPVDAAALPGLPGVGVRTAEAVEAWLTALEGGRGPPRE